MSFATRQQLLLGLAVIMMLVPTFLYSAGLLGRAPLFEGDVRKEMTCAVCNGLGRSANEDSCPTCRGRGVADFIIPGPNRPIQMVGTVKSAAGKVLEGAEIATRQAEGDDTQLILKTNGDGQFGIKLPPGGYVMTVSADGHGSLTENIQVAANKEPLPARGTETLHRIEREFTLPK